MGSGRGRGDPLQGTRPTGDLPSGARGTQSPLPGAGPRSPAHRPVAPADSAAVGTQRAAPVGCQGPAPARSPWSPRARGGRWGREEEASAAQRELGLRTAGAGGSPESSTGAEAGPGAGEAPHRPPVAAVLLQQREGTQEPALYWGSPRAWGHDRGHNTPRPYLLTGLLCHPRAIGQVVEQRPSTQHQLPARGTCQPRSTDPRSPHSEHATDENGDPATSHPAARGPWNRVGAPGTPPHRYHGWRREIMDSHSTGTSDGNGGHGHHSQIRDPRDPHPTPTPALPQPAADSPVLLQLQHQPHPLQLQQDLQLGRETPLPQAAVTGGPPHPRGPNPAPRCRSPPAPSGEP